MPFPLIPLAIAGISGLAGALRNRGQKSTQTSTSSFSPGASSMNDAVLAMLTSRLKNPSALPPSYETGGVNQINRAYDLAGQGTQADLTSRGLSTSPVAASVLSRQNNARAGEIGQFRGNLPLVERDLQHQDFAQVLQALSLQPRNSTTTGKTSGNMLGGGIEDLGSMLAFLFGSGAFGGVGGK
jgi:hypothetical protein